jgi:hypothetical protein
MAFFYQYKEIAGLGFETLSSLRGKKRFVTFYSIYKLGVVVGRSLKDFHLWQVVQEKLCPG